MTQVTRGMSTPRVDYATLRTMADEAIVADLNNLIPELLPGAKRDGQSWRCGSIDGEAGSSLIVGPRGFKDFATDEGGSLIDLIRLTMGLDGWQAAYDWAYARYNLLDAQVQYDPHAAFKRRQRLQERQKAQEAEDKQKDADTLAYCLEVVNRSFPLDDERSRPAQLYLSQTRGFKRDRIGPEPLKVMGFDPVKSDLIFKVDDAHTGDFVGLHRITITADGQKALGRASKRRLGRCKTPVIRFHPEPQAGMLALAEGPETALSLWCYSDIQPIWCCVDAGGMKRFPVRDDVTALHVFADNGPAGEDAGDTVCRRYADAGRWANLKVSELGDFDDQAGGHA